MEKVVILFERGASPDLSVVELLDKALTEGGYSVYIDRHLKISVDWARSVDERIRHADSVIAVFSAHSLDSEMLNYELDVVNDSKLKNRKLKLVCVPVGPNAAARGASGPLLGGYQTCAWQSQKDSALLIAEIIENLTGPAQSTTNNLLLGSSGGGVSTESPFYIQREGDIDLKEYLQFGEATTLIKGARQSGKTSLVGQGLRIAREYGYRAVVTDLQRLGSNLYAVENDFYQAITADLARQLNLGSDHDWDWSWDDLFGPTSNLDEYIRSLVVAKDSQIVWFMDEADWLFSTSFADGFFALVRSWHNARALSADIPWHRFSVVIAYATEAHLFIQDINQSPFNVGKRIELKGFKLRETEELNKRYGEPLQGIDQVHELQSLLDGQPFLTRVAFDVLLRSNGNLRALLASADSDDGPFGDHLRRVLVSVTQLSTVRDTIDRVLANSFVESSPDVDRLVSAGILEKNSSGNHVIRCKLYRKYLERHLK
jgi:hypothetical protein